MALSGGYDSQLILWDIELGQAIRRIEGIQGLPHVDFSSTGDMALSASGDKVQLWRLDLTQETLLTWIAENRYVPELTCQQQTQYNVKPLCE